MTSLYEAVLEILETPHSSSEVMAELYRYKVPVAISQNGFMAGYLNALVDIAHIYVIGTISRRKLYSKYPGIEYAHRRCPYCQTNILIFDSDTGSKYPCPKCKEVSIVVMTFRDGVQLKKAEGIA